MENVAQLKQKAPLMTGIPEFDRADLDRRHGIRLMMLYQEIMIIGDHFRTTDREEIAINLYDGVEMLGKAAGKIIAGINEAVAKFEGKEPAAVEAGSPSSPLPVEE